MCFICERERWDSGDSLIRWSCCAMYSFHIGGGGIEEEGEPNTNLFACTNVFLLVVVAGKMSHFKTVLILSFSFVVLLQSRIVHFVVYLSSSSRAHSSSSSTSLLTSLSLLLFILVVVVCVCYSSLSTSDKLCEFVYVHGFLCVCSRCSAWRTVMYLTFLLARKNFT